MKAARVLIAALAMGAFAEAHALIVFDPNNFVRNTVTAYQSVIAEQQRYTQILNEMRQLDTMYRNLEPARAGLLTDQVNRNAQLAPLYEAYVAKLADLDGALDAHRGFLQQLRTSYLASGLSVEDWSNQMADLLRAKDERTEQLYGLGSAVIKRVRDAIASRNALYDRILSAGGALEVSQTTAAVLAQVEANTADMSALWAGLAQRAAEEDARRSAEEERYRAWRRTFEENRQRQDEAARRIWKTAPAR